MIVMQLGDQTTNELWYYTMYIITLILCFQIYYNDSDAVGTKVSHRVATIDGVAVKRDSAVYY